MACRARLLAGGVALGALIATGAPAMAQVADDGNTIDAVIVTAAKREQNLQDVPISMNVTSQEALEAFNIADMKALSMTIPSMTVLRTNSVNTITLRGFGSGPNNAATDQTVALYNDGIYQGRARQFMAPYFDVARVEVLRGPQGALIGKNTAAGAVSIVSNMPTDTFQGEVTGSYLFDRNGYDVYGYVSGPISETLKGRLAAKMINDEGWVSNLATGQRDPRQDFFNVRGILSWQATENLEIVAKFQFDDNKVDGRAMAGFPATLTKDQAVKLEKRASGINGVSDHDYQKGYHGAITATLDLGELTLVAVSGYEEFSSESWAAAGHADPVNFATVFTEEFQQYSQEVRLLSATGQKFEWIVGGYVDSSQHGVDNTIRYAGRFLTFNLDGQMSSFFEQEGSTVSAFGTGTYHLTDAARLIAGARWTRVHKKGAYVFGRDFGQNFVGAVPTGPFRDSFSESHFDPSLTLQYDISPDVMVYATYGEGSKGGTFQGSNRSVTAATFVLKPERSTNYEAGFKARAFNWLTLDVAAYRLEFKDLQTGQYVNGLLLTKNAGAARSQGVEVVAAADFDRLRFDFTGAYNDAKFTDYPGAACTQAQINAGCVNGVTPVNAKGRTFAFVPKWSGRAQATYEHPINDKLKASATAAVYFASTYFVDSGTFNPIIGLQNPQQKVDLRFELSDVDDRWSIALIGKNVGDEITSSGVYAWPFATPPLNVYTIDEPSSWSIQGRVKF